MVSPEFEAHAAQARARCRAQGLADCMHYAENATSRADALYARLAEFGDYPGAGCVGPGLLADGRMVCGGVKGIVTVVETMEDVR
jgi:hypothetical protein